MISLNIVDILFFVVGIVVGTAFSFYVGKFVFSHFFKNQMKLITIESTAKFSSIQQVVNYVLGFAIGTSSISPAASMIFLVVWLGVQTWLAISIFKFKKPMHGFSFALVDTGADLILGSLFGAGASTFAIVPGFELVRLAIGG